MTLKHSPNQQRVLPQALPHQGSVGCRLRPFWILWTPVLPGHSMEGDILWELELWLDQASTGCDSWGCDLELPRGLPPNHHSSYTSTTCDVNLGSLHTSSSLFNKFLGGIFRTRHGIDRNIIGKWMNSASPIHSSSHPAEAPS